MTGAAGRRFVVLDRDGTLIVDKVYLADPAGIEFLPGVIDGLRTLKDAGLGLIVATNQSGVGRGYFGADAVEQVHRRLVELLAGEGITLDGIYHCPHAPEAGCDCRKPAPGLIERAVRAHGFDPARAIMIGDGAADMALAEATGMFGIQLRAPGAAPSPAASLVVQDFGEAARAVLQRAAGDVTPCI